MKTSILVLLAILAIIVAVAGCSSEDGGIDDTVVIDLDMSEMSGVLVYSQVVNIYESPEVCMAKTIMVQGAASGVGKSVLACLLISSTVEWLGIAE